MIEYIFHISDIHIMEKNYVNLRHSFGILVNDILKYGVDKSLLVIAGDIFESKSYLVTDDIHQWKSMCLLLKKHNIKTLVMCGNHDYNINSALVRDNVTLLTNDYNNIVCVNETEIKDGIIFGDSRLEFYIFSPIDKKIPRILDTPNTIKIAILHEPINDAKYDNYTLISNARFVPKDLSEYDYVLLGDIHLHQFLTPKMAYSGSFVQKTKGEGINKGYILWNLADKKGTFHTIPLKEVYLKIQARNDVCDLPEISPNQKVRHLTLIYKNCSPTYIVSLKNTLLNKYKYIHRIINNTNDPIDYNEGTSLDKSESPSKSFNEMLLSKQRNHDDIIREILHDDHNLDNIIKHHMQVMQDRNGIHFTTYKLNYLYWENIFCYGPDNYINFASFDNDLVMINGKNKEGKSSIIDILIRVLFNENDRGLKEDLINKSQTKGFIKLSFNIGPDEYTIEQVHYRTAKNHQHRLYKNGVNITQDTIINTYKYIRTVIGIGDYKNFVNLTTALQNRRYLVDMPQKDFISLLTQVTNIDVLTDVEQMTKKEITKNRAIAKKDSEKLKDIPEIKESEIKALEVKKLAIADERKDLYNKIAAINKQIIELSKGLSTEKIPENIKELLAKSKQETEQYRYFNFSFKTIDPTQDDLDKINVDIQILEQQINAYGHSNETIDRIIDTEYDLQLYDKRDGLLRKIQSLRDSTYKPKEGEFRNIKDLQIIINDFVNWSKHANINIIEGEPVALEKCNITEPIQLVESDSNDGLIVKGLPDFITIKKDVDDLEKKIQSYNSNYGSLKFAENCEHCCNNKKNISGMFNIEKEKQTLNQLSYTLSQKRDIETAYEKAKQYNYNKTQNSILERNARIIAYNRAIVEMKEVQNKRNWDILKRIEEQEAIFKEYDFQQLILKRDKNVNARKYISSFLKYKYYLHLDSIQQSDNTNNALIEELNNKEREYKVMLEFIDEEITNTTEEYRFKFSKYEMRNSLIESHNEAIRNLEFYNSYLKVVNCKTGLPSIILKNVVQLLETRCNDILRQITDFTIKIVYDIDLKIFTVENEMLISAQLGSGMQRFCLDLIFRIVLTEISSISCPAILFCDEGFGTLDKESFISVANILQQLKGKFDAMFIISHISELISYCDKSINVYRDGLYSKVQYGQLTNEQRSLRLQNDIHVNSKRVAEFKDSVRESSSLKKKERIEPVSNDGSDIDYSDDNTDLSLTDLKRKLIEVLENGKLFCKACNKSYVDKKGFLEKHMNGITARKKHDKYLQNL